jgi:WD40 repeat protein
MPLAMPRLRTFFANRRLQILLFLIIPCALFFFMRARLSWRPRVLGQMQGVNAMAWSPDGKYLAILANYMMGNKDEVWIYGVGEQTRIHRFKSKAEFSGFLQFSADSRTLYVLEDGFLRSWHLPGGQERISLQLKSGWSGIALSPDGTTYVHSERGIVGRRTSDGKILWALKPPVGIAAPIRFSSDGKRLAVLRWQSSITKRPTVEIWNLISAQTRTKPEKQIVVSKEDVHAHDMLFNSQQNIVYMFRKDVLSAYDLQSGGLKAQLHIEGPVGTVGNKASFSSDNSLFAATVYPGSYKTDFIQLREWPLGNLQRVLRSKNKSASFYLPTFSPNGDTLAAVDDKGFIVLWRIR